MVISKKEKINLFTLVMLSSAFVVSIRNVPTMAETGMQMVFFGFVSAVCFFIPAALISAELATGWSKEGGIFVWVEEAFGTKWGFWASWLQWTNMLLSVISMLYFVGGSLAYVIAPDLAASRIFLLAVLLLVLWSCTFISLKGIKANSLVSTVCFLGGVLIPGLFIIGLGIWYLVSGNISHLDFSLTKSNIFPDFKNITTLVLILGFARTFTGIEASSNHAGRVINPNRSYPIAILIVVILGLATNLLGAVSVAVVIPKEEISLVAGIMEAFNNFLKDLNIPWLVPYLGILVAGGAVGGANAWLMGPIKGLLETAKRGDLPPMFKRVNSHGIPTNLMIMQGLVISVVGAVLLLSPSINLAFWIAVALSMMIYVTMYFMMMLAGIYLRYKRPKVPRAYRIPGKRNSGMWIVAILGMVTLVLLFTVALFPPAQLPGDSDTMYFSVILGGFLIVIVVPFIIEFFKKKRWANKK